MRTPRTAEYSDQATRFKIKSVTGQSIIFEEVDKGCKVLI